MGSRKPPTINLAKISLQMLKSKEGCLQKVPPCRAQGGGAQGKCAKENLTIPAPPRQIKYKAIQICPVQPVQFIHPAVPCICPPCPICPPTPQRIKKLLGLMSKAAFLYIVYELIKSGNYWGDADASTEAVSKMGNLLFALLGAEQRYGSSSVGLLDLNRIKYNLFTLWDKFFFTIFWYTIGLPSQYYNDAAKKVNKALFCDGCAEELEEKKRLEEEEKMKQEKKMLARQKGASIQASRRQ